jgi:hypothetical protein
MLSMIQQPLREPLARIVDLAKRLQGAYIAKTIGAARGKKLCGWGE